MDLYTVEFQFSDKNLNDTKTAVYAESPDKALDKASLLLTRRELDNIEHITVKRV